MISFCKSFIKFCKSFINFINLVSTLAGFWSSVRLTVFWHMKKLGGLFLCSSGLALCRVCVEDYVHGIYGNEKGLISSNFICSLHMNHSKLFRLESVFMLILFIIIRAISWLCLIEQGIHVWKIKNFEMTKMWNNTGQHLGVSNIYFLQ